MHLSVVIPAYNEERRLPKTLMKVSEYLVGQNYDYEILVVNDGSKDKTAQLTKELEASIKNLRLIDNKDNHGKGYVVRQGMLEAKGDFRLFMDADNSTSIDHVEKMWPLFKKGCDVVIGSRDSKDAAGARQAVFQPFSKRLLGNLGNILIQLVAVPGIWDTQCGFKGFSAKAAEDIFPRLLIDRWGFDIEILAVARMLEYKIGKTPVFWINDPESKVKLSGYLQVFRELFIVKWNLIRHKYDSKAS